MSVESYVCLFAATAVSAVSYSQTLEKFSLKSLRSVLFSFGKLSLTVSCCCNQEFVRYFRRNDNLGLVQTSNFTCAEPNNYLGRPKLLSSAVDSDGRTLHVPNLIRGEKKYHPYCLK